MLPISWLVGAEGKTTGNVCSGQKSNRQTCKKLKYWQNKSSSLNIGQPRPKCSNKKAYLIFVISFTQAFCAVEIFYTQNALFVTKLNSRQNVNRSNALCKMIHCGKIPIYCVKSPIQCKITCCGQNCTLNVWLHHENHTLSCTFCVNYTTFVKYMDHFHVQSRKFYTWQKKFTQAPPVVPVTNMRYVPEPN